MRKIKTELTNSPLNLIGDKIDCM